MKKRNAPGRRTEGVECLLAGDIDAYTAEAPALQHIRSRLPILSRHVGLDRLAGFGEVRHG